MILVDTSVLIDFFKGENKKCSKKLRYFLQQRILFRMSLVQSMERKT